MTCAPRPAHRLLTRRRADAPGLPRLRRLRLRERLRAAHGRPSDRADRAALRRHAGDGGPAEHRLRLPYAAAQPFLGPLGDRFGKTRCMQVCIVALASTLTLGAFAPDFPMLLGSRIAQRRLRRRPDPARAGRPRRRLRHERAPGDDRPDAVRDHHRADARLGGLGLRQRRLRLAQFARHRGRRRAVAAALAWLVGPRAASSDAGAEAVGSFVALYRRSSPTRRRPGSTAR